MTLEEAIEDLYRITHIEKLATSTARLKPLAAYCIDELAARGLAGASREVLVPGGGRDKFWDVAWSFRGRIRLAISLKSILRNVTGSVPNRIDELVGESANAQMIRPEIVLGYLCVFDKNEDSKRRDGVTWSEFFESRIRTVSGRAAPHWSVGTVEQVGMIYVDFSASPQMITPAAEVSEFFDTLVAELRQREPLAGA